MRFHVHTHVENLQASIAFYSKMFGAEPSRVESDYAKWEMPGLLSSDPAAVEGTEEVRRRAFHEVALMMKRRIDIMRSLPLASLDRLAIQKQVRDIANQ